MYSETPSAVSHPPAHRKRARRSPCPGSATGAPAAAIRSGWATAAAAAWGTNSPSQAGTRTISSCKRKAWANSCQTVSGSVASVCGSKAGESLSGSTRAGGNVERVKYGRPGGYGRAFSRGASRQSSSATSNACRTDDSTSSTEDSSRLPACRMPRSSRARSSRRGG